MLDLTQYFSVKARQLLDVKKRNIHKGSGTWRARWCARFGKDAERVSLEVNVKSRQINKYK